MESGAAREPEERRPLTASMRPTRLSRARFPFCGNSVASWPEEPTKLADALYLGYVGFSVPSHSPRMPDTRLTSIDIRNAPRRFKADSGSVYTVPTVEAKMETRCKVPTRLFLTLAFWLLPFQASAQAPANCAPGKVMCGTQCVNLSINARNCGACGAVCGAGRTCSAGKCSR